MEALVKTKHGRGFMAIKEVKNPEPDNNEVLIKIKAAGICGSDVHFYDGSLTHCLPPVILGHEFSGEIIQVGDAVTRFSPNDRVVSEPHKGGCGLCMFCQTGQMEVCPEKRAIGYKIDGAFAPYITMPEASLHRIPDHLSFEHAALAEPLAVVIKGVLERTKVKPEDFVVVLGCGPVGLLAANAVKAGGARSVMITGTDLDEGTRLKAARQMNIDHVLNIQQKNIKEAVLSLTNGIGADLVVEACGVEAAINQAFDILRTDGRIAAIGHTGRDSLSVPWETGLRKAAHVTWSFSSNWSSWERAVSMLSCNKIEADQIVTDTFPLKEWKAAFESLERLEAIKVLLLP
ncbi:MAG: alcohol dehydrogenase catalytic domain-containing protein [Methanosarcinaceae archaeon]|nr:alcohol dehydrogenase catalytic domain-containing protein [Methanosarcinaceae archaeon]